jgi:hypothetical protein
MEPIAFGFCFLTAGSCNSSLVHTPQPQLLLTGSNHHARLRVSLPYSNLTFWQSGRTVLHNEGGVSPRLPKRNYSLAMSSAEHRCGERNGRNRFAFFVL